MNLGNLKTELYDLATDSGEMVNLAEQQPERVQQLEELMARVRQPSADFPLKPLDKPARGNPDR
jgi:hypothetical protein